MEAQNILKKTPLYQWHESHGGRMVPFAGYSLPVQYEKGIIAEHNAVRNMAGIFDVSHMGEFVISGKDALQNIQNLLTNDFTNMKTGRVRYTMLCNDKGGILDDLVVYKMDEFLYILVVNAANREKDAAWIRSRLFGAVSFYDISDSLGQIALQGPLSEAILRSVSNTIPLKYYSFIERGKIGEISCMVSRTGYTGEDGFEFYCKNEDTLLLWEILLEAGKNAVSSNEAGTKVALSQGEAELIPCGLGARDTLRLEAGMPLYGHEMDETITPFEAGLSFAVKMEKMDFIGKAALEGKINPSRIRIGIEITGRGIVREASPVFYQGRQIGITTSGSFCPYLEKAFAMALVDVETAVPGTWHQGALVESEVRGRMIEGKICAIPFYKRS
ncbi:MAG: glycine cleavage system aminomethyltransferase GcvT [Treponema sp.]|jgi:aminomethyltransferase|nr:glycine cleavage system aminomethyltransferase GcvT [Treponema sp.]